MYCRISSLPHHLLWCYQLFQAAAAAAVAGAVAGGCFAALRPLSVGGAVGVLELILIM